jgi:hypothetical protein
MKADLIWLAHLWLKSEVATIAWTETLTSI